MSQLQLHNEVSNDVPPGGGKEERNVRLRLRLKSQGQDDAQTGGGKRREQISLGMSLQMWVRATTYTLRTEGRRACQVAGAITKEGKDNIHTEDGEGGQCVRL
jgi:hypothetical protein